MTPTGEWATQYFDLGLFTMSSYYDSATGAIRAISKKHARPQETKA